MRVWIVIVHHRGEPVLRSCLEALSGARGVEAEVVIVQNGAEEPVSEQLRRDHDFHLVPLPEGVGFGEANNRGITWACRNLGDADAYFFLNNDTRVEPDALARLVEVLEERPECGIVGPFLLIDGFADHINSLGLNVTVTAEAWDEGIGQQLSEYEGSIRSREVLAITGAALLIRASCYSDVGGWSEHYGFYQEDIDLCLKARSRSWSVRLETEARVLHQISASSDGISDFKVLLSWRNRFVLMVSRWPLLALLRWVPEYWAREVAVFLKRRSVGAHRDAGLQARSWLGSLKLLPRALWERRRSGWTTSWWRMMRARGTVPVITLPAKPTEGRRVATEEAV
ncbi:MAG: glycosyltransferase family 2 protein [Acidobacteria bacterium]|nr:MAG: glycosyltransferase family 2 protein [Acidobacteriota bacterium]REK07974.1 MAG: glycosyltransferase family 2 protein [Acidobacteriota bacterium]